MEKGKRLIKAPLEGRRLLDLRSEEERRGANRGGEEGENLGTVWKTKHSAHCVAKLISSGSVSARGKLQV